MKYFYSVCVFPEIADTTFPEGTNILESIIKQCFRKYITTCSIVTNNRNKRISVSIFCVEYERIFSVFSKFDRESDNRLISKLIQGIISNTY